MFAGYRDVQLIGAGGLGRISRAVRISTGGVVAIKQLSDVSEASVAWRRARRELDALLLLKGHPYVVSVEEILEEPTGPCIVMEYAFTQAYASSEELDGDPDVGPPADVYSFAVTMPTNTSSWRSHNRAT